MTVVTGSMRTPRSWSSVGARPSPSTSAGSAPRTGAGYQASSVRPETPSMVVSPVAAALGMALHASRLRQRGEVGLELFAELPARHGDGPAREVDVQVLLHVDEQLAAVELDGDRRVAAAQDVRHGGARRAGAAGQRLADAPLEDPRADAVGRQH